MRHLLSIILLLGLVACSRENSRPARTQTHKYAVTFAAVKIPNDVLKQHGCKFDEKAGYDFGSLESRYKFAAYVLAHKGDFSFTTPTGNCLPIVRNYQQTSVRLLLDPKQEEVDFKTFGIMTTRFEVGIDVQGDNGPDQVACSWSCNYMVHLKEPIGNSTDQGGSGAFGGLRLNIGQPDITLLFRGKGVTLWMLVALNRE